jgi:SAM-dependent methyltransferase
MTEQLDPRYFQRDDESPDPEFYQMARLTVHIDDGAIAAATQAYRELLPAGGAILDLMSSWRSHLPRDVSYARVSGLGMNDEEMADNPQLSDFVVHDLNAIPRLPYANAAFDGCCVTVSVQYLTQPVEVFREVNRVLRPGAPFVLTFSNRCFPTKAIAAWRFSDDRQHASLIARYFHLSGNWGEVRAQDRSPRDLPFSDPLYVVWAAKSAED